MNTLKVDLSLLNKLVKELNDQLTIANKMKDMKEVDSNNHLYVSEAAKCMGLVSAVAVEATSLSHDFMKDIKLNSVPASALSAAMDVLGGDPFNDWLSPKKKN